MQDKSYLVRQLVPKSYHFDGYNKLNCPNQRDRPFFQDNVIPMGDHYLTTRLICQNTLLIEFTSICYLGEITFETYWLSLDTYVEKLKKAIREKCDFITFEIKTHSSSLPSSSCKTCINRSEDCSNIRNNLEDTVHAAISFHTSDVKEALAAYYQITNTTRKGDILMKNGKKKNLFGMNFELGMSKDSNIAATLMGIAVKDPTSGNWYTFDQATNTRRNLANLKMGNFPIFLLPTKVLAVGDLIKKSGKYFYVKSLNPSGTITLLGAADGLIKELVPEESLIPGMSLYTKVVAFDTKTLTDPSSNQNMSGNVLAAMCLMGWAKGDSEDEFSLDNISDDSFNGLGSLWPVLAMSGGNLGGMFTNADLSTLMMIGSGLDDDSSGMMKALVISQLLGGNATGNNPISNMVSQLSIPGVTTAAASDEATKVICPSCNITYPSGTNFCPKCGGKTKAIATICRKCGSALMEGAMFCHKCGCKVAQDTCPTCGKTVSEEELFCSKCGTSLKPKNVTIPNSPATSSTPDFIGPQRATEPTAAVSAPTEKKV